jgi:phage-related protein
MKRLTARFYRNSAGNLPVRDWLLALPVEDRGVIGRDIAKVEFGWPIGMPVSRSIGKGLREVRSTIRNGKVEARVIFAIDGDDMILPARPREKAVTAAKRDRHRRSALV